MLVKDRLAWHREEGLRVRGHAVVFPSTEPKSASFVQVSHIAHAVPDEFPIADLGQCGLSFPLVILPGYHRSFNYDFTDLCRRKCQRLVPCWKDLIADPDNLQPLHQPAGHPGLRDDPGGGGALLPAIAERRAEDAGDRRVQVRI